MDPSLTCLICKHSRLSYSHRQFDYGRKLAAAYCGALVIFLTSLTAKMQGPDVEFANSIDLFQVEVACLVN